VDISIFFWREGEAVQVVSYPEGDGEITIARVKCLNPLALDFFFQILAHPVFKI
jgi:hypothetical protein